MPSNTIKFLTLDEVVEIHSVLIQKFGGPPGIRDMGLLESALFRPQTGYYETLEKMGAALFESLIKNRPFVDGNKRVAFFTTDIFFRLNGYKFSVQPKTAHTFLMKLFERNQCDLDHLLPWIEKNLVSCK